MSIENNLNKENQPEQEITPQTPPKEAPEAKTKDDKKSPFQIRTHKNPERGTELIYATIPLKDIESEEIFHLLSDEINKLYESQGVNQDRSPVYSGGRTFSPPNHAEYSMGYWAGYNRSDKEVFEEVVEGVRKFVKSKDREMIYPLRGKIDKATGSEDYEYYFLSLKKVGGKLLIRPQPFVHTLFRTAEETSKNDGSNTLSSQYFGTLKSILESGFIASTRNIDGNAISKKSKGHKVNNFYNPAGRMKNEPSIVNGDAYSIELFPDEGHSYGGRSGEYVIERASPERISSINIQLFNGASEQEKEAKMQFYKKEITEKYHIPIHFLAKSEYEE